MQHDPRAGRPRGRERAPTERWVDVVRVDDPGPGAPHGVGDVVGLQAAPQHPGRSAGSPEHRRGALEQLHVLAEPLADEPHEILDRPFLTARRAVTRVEEQDHAANLDSRPAMRVAVLAEFYPRAHDPVLGVWAHRQACAVRDAGADVSVFVLHRIVPPASAFTGREFRRLLAQPHHAVRDGLPVTYIRYISPPRARAYATWGAWAAPALRRALRRASEPRPRRL